MAAAAAAAGAPALPAVASGPAGAAAGAAAWSPSSIAARFVANVSTSRPLTSCRTPWPIVATLPLSSTSVTTVADVPPSLPASTMVTSASAVPCPRDSFARAFITARWAASSRSVISTSPR